MVDKALQLGAWSTDRKALEEMPISGRGNDADAPDSVRFIRSVMQLIVRREMRQEAEYDRAAAFVLVPREWMDSVSSGTRRQPLLSTGQYSLTGQIHFVNVAINGRSLEYEGNDAGLFDKLEAMDARAFPTLVYLPKQGSSTVSWYSSGIVSEDSPDVWCVTEAPPTAERITEVISRAYTDELITPDQMAENCRVWEDSAKGWAHKDAESRVQHAVRLTLLGAFLHCSIRQEQPGKDGRTDLEIVEDRDRSSDQVVHHAVLEMKVLREKGSSGGSYTDQQIANHICDGLKQAYSYGKRRNFRESMLCCFDMRPTNTGAAVVFREIQEDATKLGVQLRHWFLYRSSEHWRDCSVAQVINPA